MVNEENRFVMAMLQSTTVTPVGSVGFGVRTSMPMQPGAARKTRDNRWAKRRAHRLPAFILTNDKARDLSCFVIDMSSTGLQMELRGGSSAGRLPNKFSIYIPIENVQYAGEVIWRSGNRAGVFFSSSAQIVARPPGRRINKTEPAKKSLIGSLFGSK